MQKKAEEPKFSEQPRGTQRPINNNNQRYVENSYRKTSPDPPRKAPNPVNSNNNGYGEKSFRRNSPDQRRGQSPVRKSNTIYADNHNNSTNNFKKPYKLSSVIKYPKFDNSGTKIPELFFEKFENIIDMNLTYGSLEDVHLKHKRIY